MKRAIVAGAVVASLTLAGPASAATPTEKRLTRQVTALQKDVAALKKQVKELDQVANVLAALTFCSTAITADAFQGTWTVLDQKAGGATVGPQQAVNDAGACNALSIPRSSAAPPNLNPFHAFMRILQFRTLFGGGF
jgi:outer membrane murein-binding lipoprotein Lpp